MNLNLPLDLLRNRTAAVAALGLAVFGATPDLHATIFPATKDTCFNKGAPDSYYGTAAYLPRSEKGGDPYWDVALGFLLLDFDRAAVLAAVETELGHPGTMPTLAELSLVTLNLNVMSAEDKTATIGVPALIMSATDTNWTEAGVAYSGVDAALGGASIQRWKDQNGNEVSTLRDVLQHNDQMPGGMIRNSSGRPWAPANSYTTWKLDPAVILNYLNGANGVAGVTLVTDGAYYDDNGGAYSRESTNPSRSPYLELLSSTPPPDTLPIDTNGSPTIAGTAVFPKDHILNTPVDTLPLHTNSATWIATIGTSGNLHPDFGPDGSIPFIVVSSNQPLLSVTFDNPDESDPGPYPIPTSAPIEGGPDSNGDRHVLALDKDTSKLYELYSAYPGDNSWQAGSGAVFDISSYTLRPAGWTSTDAAGLPVLPLLVRYQEIASGEIRHAIRFTVPQTQRKYLWPARHYASTNTDDSFPPMGARVRLKADYDISGFDPTNQVILRALKRYGMILADNGSPWFITGAPDPAFDNDQLHRLTAVTGGAFEVVDCTYLMIDSDSGQARSPEPVFRSVTVTTNSFSFSAELLPNLSHTVEKRSSLTPSAGWILVEQFTPTASGLTTRSYPLDGTNMWFYRIRR